MTEKQQIDESEEGLEVGGKIDEVSISIRFSGDDLDPDELTALLNCEPTEAYEKGQTIITTISPRTIKTGMWFLSIQKNSEQTLEEQIWELLEKLPKDLEVWEKLSGRFRINIYCGAWLKNWNRDVWFSANLLKQIANRKLSIGLAIYFDLEVEDDG